MQDFFQNFLSAIDSERLFYRFIFVLAT